MQRFFCRVVVADGDREYIDHLLLTAEMNVDAEAFVEDHVSRHLLPDAPDAPQSLVRPGLKPGGSKWYEFFDGEDRLVKCDLWQIIPEADYQILEKYLKR